MSPNVRVLAGDPREQPTRTARGTAGEREHPDGRTVTLALERFRSTGPGPRIGSLLFNPGGPGISGISDFADRYSGFSHVLQQRFDIVGFDPARGGRSAPVRCLTDRHEDDFLADSADAATSEGRALDAGCDRGAQAALLPFLGTRDTARDLDRIRAALGDPKLTYLGLSYGTVLGSVYTQEYPGRVRALVLDGAIDPAVAPLDRDVARATGLQRGFAAFAADCTIAPGCAWQPGGDLLTAYRRLIAAIRTRPLPAGAGRTLTSGLAVAGVGAGLPLVSAWPRLAAGLAEAANGDGSGLLALADGDARASDGRYDNAVDTGTATLCMDQPVAARRDRLRAGRRRGSSNGPRRRERRLPERGLRVVPATGTVGPVHAPGTPPILVVGTTGDPATPYAASVSLACQFPRGVLLTRVGDGQTAYATSTCATDAIDDYLLTLRIPTGRAARCDP